MTAGTLEYLHGIATQDTASETLASSPPFPQTYRILAHNTPCTSPIGSLVVTEVDGYPKASALVVLRRLKRAKTGKHALLASSMLRIPIRSLALFCTMILLLDCERGLSNS